MNHEFFLGKDNCDCQSHLSFGIIIAAFVVVLMDCIYSCSTNKHIEEVEAENRTLKGIITTSIDRTLNKLLKNGNDYTD
jgi:hypothetical protein